MKFLKTYEQNFNEPKTDDYVICEVGETHTFSDREKEKINNFLKKTIGQINHYYNSEQENLYAITYPYLVPRDLRHYFSGTEKINMLFVKREDILHWAKNKEDLEYIIEAEGKYNL